MQQIRLVMVHHDITHAPFFPCPPKYSIRLFQRGGDEWLWATIETEVGEFPNRQKALARFETEFGPFLDEMENRCFFLQRDDGQVIGTATAWSGDREGETWGRVHWVGIVPAYQGRALSKPLFSVVMARLAREYQKAYLTTQTASYQAVSLYLSFGFTPYLSPADASKEGWLLMERVLQRRIL